MRRSSFVICSALAACIVLAAGLAGVWAYLQYGDDARHLVARKKKAAQYERIDFYGGIDPRLTEHLHSLDIPQGEVASFCTDFVYRQTTYRPDEHYNRNMVLITGAIVENLATGAHKDVPVLCDSRALLLGGLLRSFGIPSRIVQVLGYRDDGDFMGHTFLEARENGRWAACDPTYGAWFEHRATGRAVTAMDMVLGDIADLVPVTSAGRGWEDNAARLDRDFFDRLWCVLVYDNRMNGESSVAVVNTARIARVTGGGRARRGGREAA